MRSNPSSYSTKYEKPDLYETHIEWYDVGKNDPCEVDKQYSYDFDFIWLIGLSC